MIKNDNDQTKQIIEALQERKSRNITIVDMSHIEGAAYFQFIIAEGNSTTHVDSIADCVRDFMLEKYSTKPYNYDGYKASEWIVIDYGTVLVHIFVPEVRRRYNLEELWSDAVITEIPDAL